MEIKVKWTKPVAITKSIIVLQMDYGCGELEI